MKIHWIALLLPAVLLVSPSQAADVQGPGAECVLQRGGIDLKLPACSEKTFATSEKTRTARVMAVDGLPGVIGQLSKVRKKIIDGLAVLAVLGGGGGYADSDANGPSKPKFEFEALEVEKTACCGGQPVLLKGHRARFELSFSARQRFFYGIPYIGELGIRTTESLKLQDVISNVECTRQVCSTFGPALGVKGEVYANVLAGAADVSGGVKAEAKATIKICPEAAPVFRAKGEIGKLTLLVEASAAWGWFKSSYEQQVLVGQVPWVIFDKQF